MSTLAHPSRRHGPPAPTVDRRHGRARAGDRGGASIGEEPLPVPLRGRRPAGIALIGVALLGLVTGLGVLRVRTKAKGLELGAAIAELTHEHNRLLDEKRRLEAERAYLRHPDHIQRVAIERLHMEPVQPERIQAITVRPRPPEAQVQR
jgi:cell division protein FtsL